MDTWTLDGTAVQAGERTFMLGDVRADHVLHVISEPVSAPPKTAPKAKAWVPYVGFWNEPAPGYPPSPYLDRAR